MNLFDTMFPNYSCLVCKGEINKSESPLICDACVKKLPRHENICDKCGCEVSMLAVVCDRCQEHIKEGAGWHFERARSAFSYENPVIELVLRLKYNAEGDVAKFVAPWIAKAVNEYDIKTDLIIPVPLAPKRFKERGYNQSALIARELSKIIGVPVIDNFVFRTKYTTAQKKMTLKERQENLHGAFEIRPPFATVKGKRVLLIDDVLTTGSTADECARTIKRAKPESVEVLTVASVAQKPVANQTKNRV